jgi:hypothetical protein
MQARQEMLVPFLYVKATDVIYIKGAYQVRRVVKMREERGT